MCMGFVVVSLTTAVSRSALCPSAFVKLSADASYQKPTTRKLGATANSQLTCAKVEERGTEG